MYLAKEAPKVRFLRRFEKFLWETCFSFLASMNPYLAGIFSTADMTKFSRESLFSLYSNSQKGLPRMPSPPFRVISFLNSTQEKGKYNVRKALRKALYAGDPDCAMTLHMCFFPSGYIDPEILITSEKRTKAEGSIFHSMVTLEQTG